MATSEKINYSTEPRPVCPRPIKLSISEQGPLDVREEETFNGIHPGTCAPALGDDSEHLGKRFPPWEGRQSGRERLESDREGDVSQEKSPSRFYRNAAGRKGCSSTPQIRTQPVRVKAADLGCPAEELLSIGIVRKQKAACVRPGAPVLGSCEIDSGLEHDGLSQATHAARGIMLVTVRVLQVRLLSRRRPCTETISKRTGGVARLLGARSEIGSQRVQVLAMFLFHLL
jgi:hypothetical protein